MAENAPLWPMTDGTYLDVEGSLGAALMVLLGGDMDIKIMDGLVMVFGDWIHFCACECTWLGGGGGGEGALRKSMDSNSSFSVMSTIRIDFPVFEIFRHILDLRSSVSCLGSG